MQKRTAILVSLAIGVALQVWTAIATGRHEVWDTPVYWQVGMPLVVIAAGVVGYVSAGTAWTATVLIIPSQVAAMMYRRGALGETWPVSVALALAMSLPLLLVAFMTARLRPASRR